jgi:hypothetical protein
MPLPVHRLSNIFKEAEAEHLKWVCEAIAEWCEVLKSARPDTFAGRKTHEPFPSANFSYRSLELLCRQQAKLSAKPEVRSELERMALEYKQLADCQERQWPEADE